MNITNKYLYLLIALLLCSCQQNNSQEKKEQVPKVQDKKEDQKPAIINLNANATVDRIGTPKSYNRTPQDPLSFQHYLRNLPLKPFGEPVLYYNGNAKPNAKIYHSVINLDIGDKDLHQCADSIMRLRAEYLWNQKKYEEIHFNFTNGFRVDYNQWAKGKRMIIEGNKTYWDDGDKPSNEYQDFWNYLELIFTYSGTASLEKEMKPKELADANIGDVLIQGGHPGHAVIIIDEAIDQAGKKVYLLAQSYMPAQDIQILHNPMNPNLSPWYALEEGKIETPEWIFTDQDLKSF